MWLRRRRIKVFNQLDYKLFVSILFTSIALISGTGPKCPANCECKWINGKQTALCGAKQINTEPNFTSIPIGIPSATQVLNMSANNLHTLPAQVFRERGLINLQKLFISKCKLGDISSDAFLQLTNLVEIDLCDNSLEYIPTLSLEKCKSLRKLSLCQNPIQVIKSESFDSLKTLVSIDLSFCQIDWIEAKAFNGLNELRYLRLDSNRLTSLPTNALTDLQVLHALDLHHNRWHCDCKLRQSVEWLVNINVPQTVWPRCATPKRLEGHSWKALNTEEYSCSPEMHTRSTNFQTNIGQNITIYCTVSGYPLPSINWKFSLNGTQHNNLSLNNDKHFLIEKVILNETYVSSYITINDLKAEDSQQMQCLAANKGGISHQNFSLIVRQTTESNASLELSEYRITCYIIGVIIALVFVLILFMLPLIRAKKCASIRSSTLSPKLGPIDILQNVKNTDLEMKNIFSSKPEIALISDIIRDTKDLKSYRFGSDPLTTPDVTNFGPHYSAQQQLSSSNPSSTISTSMSFDTFRRSSPPLLVLDSCETEFIYNNHSNNDLQHFDNRYDNRFHYQKQNSFNLLNKSLANGVNECQKLLVLNNTRTQCSKLNGICEQTMASTQDSSLIGQELKPFLSHSESDALELDKELLVNDFKSTQSLLNSDNNSISVTQV